jgi:L-ascorbate metabolism protein UlaG (beta-lactamase superfamily)
VPVEITWVGHATVLIEIDGVRVLTDPILRRRVGPLVRVGPAPDPGVTQDLDAALISHLHHDHLDPPSLRRAGARAVLAPAGSGAWLRRRRVANLRELRVGESVAVGSVRVTAVTATHDHRRLRAGPTADPLGFTVAGSSSVYFAGDTDLYDEMQDLNGVDVALLPVWGWGTTLGPGHLDPERAAQAAALIAPRVAIPIHWGSLALPKPIRGSAGSDRPAREFVEFASRLAPEVEVRLLPPGGRTVVA